MIKHTHTSLLADGYLYNLTMDWYISPSGKVYHLLETGRLLRIERRVNP